MKAQLALACALSVGCAFGGSDEDPRIEVGPPRMDASVDVPDEMEAGEAPPPVTNQPDAANIDPIVDAGRTETDARMPPSNAACEPATPLPTCDPVHNTGCPPLTQCDLDPAASVPTGRCVFFQASVDPNTCTAAVVESCEARTTCASNACRTMCYCDGDCPIGQCCSDGAAPGPEGPVKLCKPC